MILLNDDYQMNNTWSIEKKEQKIKLKIDSHSPKVMLFVSLLLYHSSAQSLQPSPYLLRLEAQLNPILTLVEKAASLECKSNKKIENLAHFFRIIQAGIQVHLLLGEPLYPLPKENPPDFTCQPWLAKKELILISHYLKRMIVFLDEVKGQPTDREKIIFDFTLLEQDLNQAQADLNQLLAMPVSPYFNEESRCMNCTSF